MSNCPYCDVLIDEAYNFCVNCEQQVKCPTCGSYLIKGKSKCLKCGVNLNLPQSSAAPMNNFSLEEEQSGDNYSRKLNLSFTDNAIDRVAAVLDGYVPLTPPKIASPRSLKHIAQSQQLSFPLVQATAENDQTDQSKMVDDEAVEATARTVLDNNSAGNYFEKDGQGILISTTPDYKGKNKRLQQQRFILLYVWAYNFLCKEAVPSKEHLHQAARTNRVYDKNYPKYLNDVASRFFIRSDGTFKLNPGGHSEINKILTEMKDSGLSGLEYWNSTRKNTNRVSRATKENTQKIEQWVQMSSRFESFDVRTLSATVHFAVLALYDITKELKVENAGKPALGYEYLTKRYKTVPVNKKNFSDTLSSKKYEKYFECTSEGLYYLTQEAEGLANRWIS